MAEHQIDEYIVLTPYPVGVGHNLIVIYRIRSADLKPEIKEKGYVGKGDNAGTIIGKAANIVEYNKTQNAQRADQRLQPMSAKMSFKVSLVNSETGKVSPELRTLRFWLDYQSPSSRTSSPSSPSFLPNNNSPDSNNTDLNKSLSQFKSECSHVVQSYFCQLVGTKPDDDFPKNYTAFIMKLMRLLKDEQFVKIRKMEVEMRQLSSDDYKPPSRTSSTDSDGCQADSDSGNGGRSSPITIQRVLDIVDSSYPNVVSIKDICTILQANEDIVRQFISDLTTKGKVSTTDGQRYARVVLNSADTKVSLVKQMPKVTSSKQPVIAIVTAQFCEKLAVDSMISDKETFVKYRTTSDGDSANYVYTLGNIGDHRVVSTKLTSIGNSQAALIAAGNATTRLLGTFPDIAYVFLVGCAGSIANYTSFKNHVRLGDVVVSSLPDVEDSPHLLASGKFKDEKYIKTSNSSLNKRRQHQQQLADYIYVHCKERQPSNQDINNSNSADVGSQTNNRLPSSISKDSRLNDLTINNNNTETCSGPGNDKSFADTSLSSSRQQHSGKSLLDFEDCQFRMWTPERLELQDLALKLWVEGLENPRHRIWEYYIDEGVKSLKEQQDVDASRPALETDKLFMSIGVKDAIEVSHPEPSDDEIDLRKEGRPMCHFGPVGSGKPAASNDQIKQRMVSEFGLRAFDEEFDPVIESIYGNRKENYIMIRGISDYKDGRKKREWQQYSALVAAAFMKSLIVNLKPVN